MMISLQQLLERHQLMKETCTSTAITPDALHEPWNIIAIDQLSYSNNIDQENASAGPFDR
jgi:hypothetical protein